jgi:arsenate-mycothiol transferase
VRQPPRVLFVCVKNGGKSQMAEGLMRHVAGTSIEASSAGTRAGSSINAESAAALLELDIDIASRTTTQLTPELIAASDLVVVLGEDAQVDGGHTPVERWETDEPSRRGIEGMERMRLIRDDILERVESLRARLLGSAE